MLGPRPVPAADWSGSLQDAHASPSSLRVALAGAGRVGTAVAGLLDDSGHEIVGVWSRSKASTERAARTLSAPACALEDLGSGAGLVLLGVPEDALTGVAQALARGLERDAVVCHFAGAVGIGPLWPVTGIGRGACALHPVASLPAGADARLRLVGAAWGRTCSPGLEGWADSLVRVGLRGSPVPVNERDRPLWHAAAVTSANGLAALLSAAEAMLDAIGVRSPDRVLRPLMSGVLDNAGELGAAGALTGPIARGEVDVVERHLEELAERIPALLGPYVASAWAVLLAAERAGRLDGEAGRRLRATLSERWS